LGGIGIPACIGGLMDFFQNPRNPFMVGIIADYNGDYRSEKVF
jgi:hypothetical protein